MLIERGPRGRLHVPSYRDGCYRGRVTDCCLLCLLRITAYSATTPLRYRRRSVRRVDEHTLLGKRIVVPYVDPLSSASELGYREGTIDAIYVRRKNDLARLTVRTDEGEYVDIGLT